MQDPRACLFVTLTDCHCLKSSSTPNSQLSAKNAISLFLSQNHQQIFQSMLPSILFYLISLLFLAPRANAQIRIHRPTCDPYGENVADAATEMFGIALYASTVTDQFLSATLGSASNRRVVFDTAVVYFSGQNYGDAASNTRIALGMSSFI